MNHDTPELAATPAPGLEPGMRRVATVEDLAFGGEGVCRVDNFVVFVPRVIPGEEIELEIQEVKKQFARARLVSVRREAACRVTPRCPHFGICGGCQYQHIGYEAQLEFKHRQVISLLDRLGDVPEDRVAPMIPCPSPYGYRNRIMVRSQWDKLSQTLKVGFLHADNRLVVDVAECAIAEPGVNEQLEAVRAQPPPRGGLKVVVRHLPEGWDVPDHSFFQNNLELLPQLVAVAREQLKAGGTRFLVDAYCGVGFFALELADLVETYLGVEHDKQAVKAARRNATRRGRLNGDFVLGMTEVLLPAILERFPAEKTTLLLDPPRRGCDPSTIDLIRRARVAQVLLVSCHPATLARDLKRFGADGIYEVHRVVPLDMFPQTQHVECLADLRLQTRPNPGFP